LPSYKAHREEKPAGLVRDLAEAEDVMLDLCPVAFEAGYEADDCLATLAVIGWQRGEKVVLASPDKDLRQCLVKGEVTILRRFTTDRGAVAKPEWYTADTLAAEYAITPEAWPDYQALCGDSTDGVPGCEGIGDKTAAKIICQTGSIEAALKNPLALPVTPKQRVALGKFKEQAELMLKLVTLRTDVASVQDALR
jgi:DNA polymerase-1